MTHTNTHTPKLRPHTTPRTTRLSAVMSVAITALLAGQNAAAQDTNAQNDQAPTPQAADTLVVLGGLTPRPLSEVGSAISVLSGNDIDLRQITLVSDALRELPSLAVSRTGPQGALTQVRIRGAEANHTLVYIDGVKANDPISGEFNFANLVAADVAQIEVLRGAQSALYGSDSIGGVIAITTKAPTNAPALEVETEAGSFETARLFAATSTGTDTFALRASAQAFSTDGISAAPTGAENDGFTTVTSAVKSTYVPTPELTIESTLRLVNSHVDTDAQEYAFGTVQDADQSTDTDELYAKLTARADLFDGALTTRGHAALSKTELSNTTDGAVTSASVGERLDFGLSAEGHKTRGSTTHTLTLAIDHERLDFRNENPFISGGENVADDAQTSLIGEYTLAAQDSLVLSAALRQDFNDTFDDAATFRLSGAYLIPAAHLRLHASWGEGITDPTFTERFGFDPSSFVGNPDLIPERSSGFDFGVEKSLLGGDLILDVTYFQTTLNDEITTNFFYDATTGAFFSTPVNADGKSDRQGLETTLSAQLPAGLSLHAHYAHLDATGPGNTTEVRRPEHTASVNLSWQSATSRTAANLGIAHNGENTDSYFGYADPDYTPTKILDAYTLVRAAGRYQLTQSVDVFARVENALDEEYQDVIGFATPGRAAYVGVRLSR